MYKLHVICFLLASNLCFVSISTGQVLDVYSNPDPFIGKHYRENKETIEQLKSTCLDESKPPEERVKALERLHDEFSDAAISVLVKLISSADTKVASTSGELLSSLSMMMNHKVFGDDEEHENQFMKYAMEKHDLIFKGLRASLNDKRPQVRVYAAKTLAAQSDEEGLEIMSEQKNRSAYSDEEFVEYLSLSSPSVSGKYLTPYLESKNEKILTQVAGHLSEAPEYSMAVREKILFNEEVGESARVEAAKHLPNEELLPLLVSSNAKPSVYSSAMETYVSRTGKRLSKQEVKMLLEGIGRFDENAADGLKGIKLELETLYKEK